MAWGDKEGAKGEAESFEVIMPHIFDSIFSVKNDSPAIPTSPNSSVLSRSCPNWHTHRLIRTHLFVRDGARISSDEGPRQLLFNRRRLLLRRSHS